MSGTLDSFSKKLAQIIGMLGVIDAAAGGSGAGSKSGNLLSGALGKVSGTALGWSVAGNVVNGVAGMAAGASMAMPSVGSVVSRESSIYSAGVYSMGMMGRGRLSAMSMRNIGPYANIANAGAVTAGILTGMGVAPTSAAFNQMQTSSGQAARYLNMPNDVAAQAFAGFNSGSTSANLMRRMGVFTSDPRTGNALTQNQIFQQMYSRMAGGKTTPEGTMRSLQAGYLGAAIRNSGLDSSQQELLKSQFMAKSMGMNLDFSNPDSVKKVQDAMASRGFNNPELFGQKLTAAEESTAATATPSYLKGIEAATNQLVGLKEASKSLIKAFGNIKAFADTFTGDHTGQGFLGGVGSGIGAGGSIIGDVLAYKGAQSLFNGGGSGGGTGKGPRGMKIPPGYTYSSKTKRLSGGGRRGSYSTKQSNAILRKYNAGGGAKLGGKLGLAGAALNILSDIPGNIEATNAGQGGSAWGNTIGATAGSILGGVAGGALGSLLGPGGTLVGGFLGSMAGGALGGMAGEAIGSLFNATGGDQSSVKLGLTTSSGSGFAAPTTISTVSSGGEFHADRGDHLHRGVDIPVGMGSPVFAAGDGKVTKTGDGSGSNSLGKNIEIKHPNGYRTIYGHLSEIWVSPGKTVKQGQQIGRSGNTGLSTGPHLHFEVHDENGNPVNPSTIVDLNLTSGQKKGSGKDTSGGVRGKMSANNKKTLQDIATSGSGNAASGFGLTVTSSGVKGVLQNTSSVVASGMGGSLQGLSNPASQGTAYSVNIGGQEGSVKLGITTGGTRGYEPVQHPLTSPAARAVEQMSPRGSRGGNNITINLKIGKASDAEAKQFAKKVKEYLDDDKLIHNMGSR